MKHSTKNVFTICAVTAALLACSFPSQLITTTAPVEPPPPTVPPEVQPLQFISTPYKEEHKAPDYTITAQIPTMVEAIQPSVQKFDEYLNGIVQKEIAAFKDSMAQQPATPIMAGSSFDVTYEEIGQSGSIWPLKINFMGFVDGAAHPYHYSITVNYDLALERDLTLDDIFLPNSNYLQVLSDECAKQLKERGIGFEDEIFSKGADPLPENYKLWNLSKDGLIITFSEYQVGPYAAGPQVVTVPYSVLKDVLNSESPAAEFWK
jgi:hypothetical protein